MKKSVLLLKPSLFLQSLKVTFYTLLCLLAMQAVAKPVSPNPAADTNRIVVSVDHRVLVTYSAIKFDAKKGVYTTQAKIKNLSSGALLSPLRLSFKRSDLKGLRFLNAQGDSAYVQPYFEFDLPKNSLAAGATTQSKLIAFDLSNAEKNQKSITITPKAVRAILEYAQNVSAGVQSALLIPRSSPSVLSSKGGKTIVHFSVRLVGNIKQTTTVFLRRSGEKQSISMNDLGRDGDGKAGDGISSASVQIDVAKIKADSCLFYEAFTGKKSGDLVSPPLKLCVSSFPISIAKSTLDNPITLSDGLQAVADEVLITVAPTVSAAAIRQLANSINARVVGSILPLNLYQLKFPSSLNTNQLSAIIAKLRGSSGVETASANAIGQGSLDVDDPAFDLAAGDVNSQHGLKLVLGHIEPATNAWDGNDRGALTRVIILDTGLALPHTDLNPNANWTCQLASGPALVACTDTTVGITVAGHGTQVAGVLAAATNNLTGVAGTAFNSQVHSIKMIDFTLSGMAQGLNAARDYIALPTTAGPFVINASMNIGPVFGSPANLVDVAALCLAIDQAVFSGGSAVALAVVAAGNEGQNGYFYPSRCNDSDPFRLAQHDQLDPTRKNLLIPVSNSVSFDEASCGSVGLNQRCSSSNHGVWVDMAAPGSKIRTTTLGNTYASPTGTSFSAPMVSGAAAILSSCGVSLGEIEAALKGPAEGAVGANPLFVPYPSSGSATKTPLLNIPLALQRTNCSMVAVDDALAAIAEDSGTRIISFTTLTGNDEDGDGEVVQTLTITAIANEVGGTAVINGTNIEFTPTPNFNGTASFDYTVQDNGQTNGVDDFKTDTGRASFTVTAVNDVPVATDEVLSSMAEDGGVRAISIASLLANDDDGDAEAAQTLIITAVSNVIGGSAVISASNIEFTPTLNFNGAASFDYTVQDNGQTNGVDDFKTDTGHVSFTVTAVNDVPVPVLDILSTVSQNSGPHTFAFIDLTGNDSDGDPEATQLLTITGVSNPVGGTVTLDGMGNVVFALTMGFNGTASFNYTVQDDGQTNGVNDFKTAIGSASFTVTAAPVNNPPSIANQTFTHIEYNQIDPAASPAFNDFVGIVGASDPEGAPLTFSITGGNDLTVHGISQTNAFRFDAAIPGRLLVDNRLALNYEFLPPLDTSFYLAVQVSDGVNSVPATVQVTLTNDGFDNGDPHITTARGLRYDFQSAGEFVALRGGNGMEIQTRQTAIPGPAPFTDPYSGLAVGVSVNTAVAARVGNHRVTYQGNSSGVAELRIDGAMTTLPANGIDLGYGGRVAPLGGNGIQVDFPDGTTMTVTAYPWGSLVYMQVQVMHTPAREGIMGLHTRGSWLPRLSNGSSFGAMPASLYDRFVQLYETFADSWRVTDATSLFDYAPGASTSTFTHVWPTEKPPAPPGVGVSDTVLPDSAISVTPTHADAQVENPVKAPRGVVLRPVAKQVARQHCRAIIGKQEKANCIFDVMVTGNIHFVRAYQGVERIKAGLTSVEIRNNRVITRGDAPVTFTATIARHAAEIRKGGDLLSTHAIKSHAAPIGTVQFMLNGKATGKSVKLDVNGQARMKMPRNQVGKQHVGARYIPADGSVFLPSSSRNLSGSVEIARKKTKKKDRGSPIRPGLPG